MASIGSVPGGAFGLGRGLVHNAGSLGGKTPTMGQPKATLATPGSSLESPRFRVMAAADRPPATGSLGGTRNVLDVLA
ncbi:MAG: hypothetical protein HY722_00090 [Planctomycetes bacterium]|nr:hypothetical protein [Planctomycetota bacterium]